ncbi:cell adhesion molecule-related/down-regulated by oncogenes isoform X1 [Cheilinus undulatus]|uniref:cell adhesion molecule-related/down-regulated by oncogenes isoform X1 n=1 Tax=Cheilinus undulatus TaxID=241271 RepID=UPI001BD6A309|nr:cell adhesion molecule-related/down-regulated by oncogenes isoform X1 [Cheilinus undulatus]
MDSGLRVLLSTVLCLSQSLLISCSSQYPSFHSEPSSLVQSQGSVAHLSCSVSPSSAVVSWRFQGLPLDPDTLPGVELNQGSLIISSLTPSHVGVYQCVARLDHGPAIASRHAHVAIAEISEYEDGRRRSLSVQEGSSVLIECPLPHSVPPALPRLRVRGERIEVSTDDYLVLPSGNLQIISVSAQHQGMYKCGAFNPVTGETIMQSHGTKLSVKHSDSPSPVRIVYPSTPMNVSVQQSQSLTLECIVSGSPAPAAKWFKNGQEVTPGPLLRQQHNNLVFVTVTRSDEGSYTCAAETEQGTVSSANYTVNVLESVSITEGLTDQLVSPGSSAQFTCLAKGNPSPNITWLFNAEPIVPSHRFQISGSSLVVTDVTPLDEGVFQCLLDNGISSAQSYGALTTQTDPLLSSTPSPSLHPMQSDEGHERFLTKDEGDALSVPAERSSDRPTPEAPIIISPPQTHKPDVYDLEWKAGRDGGSPISAYFVKYRKVDEMGTVVGNWHTVRVPGSEKTLRLSELESSSLYEVLMVARSSAGEGQPAMLTFRTGKEKSTTSNKNPSKPPVISMAPKAPEDKTPNTHFGVVIHDRVPEAPDRPTISMATESSVYVTWIPRANGGSPITAFRVEYRRGRSTEWVVAADNISPLKLSVEVRNLEPGSTYKFRVVAMNMYGESPHSIPSKLYQVPQASPRIADRPVVGPHISSTDAISDTQIMLRWTVSTYNPSSNNNTPIQGFYIYYRPTDSDNDSDYKRDIVEGVKHWHMIGHLQPETSYDIKMQCFNDGGESEYSNVMICETRARQSPGSPSQHPITPPGPHPQEPPSPPGGLLYLIVGCVLGVMVLILLAFIAMCLWRNRQQNNMHKYDPPGYLYQTAEMNGHVLEYTTLPGSSRINGGVHGGYGHSGPMLPQGCHHLHHKLPNGLALLNGSGSLFSPGHPHSHDGTLPHSTRDCERSHPHHHHNGGGLYTALPQTESSDCMSCQNLCNNNRCYNKANGTFSSGTLPLMHRVAPCQQDGLEMVPLGQVSSQCHRSDGQMQCGEQGADAGYQPDEHRESSPSQHSCCLSANNENCPADNTAEEELECEDMEGPVVCWESLGLPDLDCDEKPGWISSSSLAGELIQPGPQEV